MKFDLTSLVAYGFAGMVTISCARHIAKGGLKEDFKVFKGHSRKVWAEIVLGDLLALALVVLCAVFAEMLPKHNFMRWSWLDLVSDSAHSGQGTNQMIAGATIPIFGVFFVALLFVNLPRLAEAEELSFRDGTKNWGHAIPRSLHFGLMHMIVGVPLWLGLALALPGMWFTGQYFKGGIPRSTVAHALYNMVIALGLFAFVLVTNFSLLQGKSKSPATNSAPSHVSTR